MDSIVFAILCAAAVVSKLITKKNTKDFILNCQQFTTRFQTITREKKKDSILNSFISRNDVPEVSPKETKAL